MPYNIIEIPAQKYKFLHSYQKNFGFIFVMSFYALKIEKTALSDSPFSSQLSLSEQSLLILNF